MMEGFLLGAMVAVTLRQILLPMWVSLRAARG